MHKNMRLIFEYMYFSKVEIYNVDGLGEGGTNQISTLVQTVFV